MVGRPDTDSSGVQHSERPILESDSPRIAIFTHDTFGLGHVRRCLHIVRALAERAPQAAILFVTGSPAVHVFEGLPPNADFVKIPTIAKTGSKGFRPPALPIPLAEVTLLRRRLIEQSLLAFGPDVLLVDNFPLGSQSELLPALKSLRRLPTRVFLGLRDFLDAPEVVRKEWTRQGIYDVLERCYDRILVYGMRDVLDVEEAYDLPPGVARKTRYAGYVTATPAPARPADEIRRELGISKPFLLATAGGGGDGFPLLKNFLRAMPLMPDLAAVVVTGPLMSAAHRNRLREQASRRKDVVVLDYVRDLRSYMAAADVVVSMCGYNIAAEITALGARAVVVPRTWRYGEHMKRGSAGAEWEQLMRAQSLQKLGVVDLLEPESLTPESLAERVQAAVVKPSNATRVAVEMSGADAVAQQLLEGALQARGVSK